ncbi:MAG: DUF1993 domain-containing protein [Myxococcales bacterium]|nr:DUF1993 domain-containing protein [Myxococcales bacterium]
MTTTMTLSDVLCTNMLGGLGTLRSVIEAAQKHAEANSIPIEELLEGRLAPDMFTFGQQVQAATDTARRITDRLSGAEASSMPDPGTSASDLLERIDQTLEHIKAADTARIDATADAELKIDLGAGPMQFTGRSLVFGFAVPNVLFHVTTAYDILRHKGVPLGKVMYVTPFVFACNR